jgi:hypothetical protein
VISLMVHLIKARIPPGSSGTAYPCLENRVNAQRPKGPRKPWLEMPSEILRNLASLASWPTKRCLLLLRCLGLRTSDDFGIALSIYFTHVHTCSHYLVHICSYMFMLFSYIHSSPDLLQALSHFKSYFQQ